MDLDKIKALALAATPGPWYGDRLDGTVKYTLLGGDHEPVIRGDNGNSDSGPFGIDKKEDEAYLLGCHPATVLELIAEVERLKAELATRCRAEGGDTFNECTSNSVEFNKSGNLNINEGTAPAAGTEKDALVEALRSANLLLSETFISTGKKMTPRATAVSEQIERALAAADETRVHTKAGKEPTGVSTNDELLK